MTLQRLDEPAGTIVGNYSFNGKLRGVEADGVVKGTYTDLFQPSAPDSPNQFYMIFNDDGTSFQGCRGTERDPKKYFCWTGFPKMRIDVGQKLVNPGRLGAGTNTNTNTTSTVVPGWAIALIVIFALGLGCVGYMLFRTWKLKSAIEAEVGIENTYSRVKEFDDDRMVTGAGAKGAILETNPDAGRSMLDAEDDDRSGRAFETQEMNNDDVPMLSNEMSPEDLDEPQTKGFDRL